MLYLCLLHQCIELNAVLDLRCSTACTDQTTATTADCSRAGMPNGSRTNNNNNNADQAHCNGQPTVAMFAQGQYAIQHQALKVAMSTATDHGEISVLKSRSSRRVVRRKNLSLSQIVIRPMRQSDVEAAARCWASSKCTPDTTI